jgi:hypothetical protein
MADSVPVATAKQKNINPVVSWPMAGRPQKEYLCGYSIMKWVDDQIARHDPPLKNGAELHHYHYRLVRKARAVVFPYGDFFPATDGDDSELHPFIALASNKGQRLPKMPRQDMVEKLQRFLGTDEPPKWFARY